MEVLSVQNQYPGDFALATDWKSQLTLCTTTQGDSIKSQPSYKFIATPLLKPHYNINLPHNREHDRHYNNNGNNNNNNNNNNYNNKIKQQMQQLQCKIKTSISSNNFNCDINNKQNHYDNTNTITTSSSLTTTVSDAAVQELSLRLLDELRTAKSHHLACTEVSIPCDLTTRIALDILRLAREEVNGLRECTIYIEFEDEPNNSRRIATVDFNKQRSHNSQAYEIYVTLRQDHRGWTALLPQFMKNLSRTITISPEFSITKHKPYSKSLC